MKKMIYRNCTAGQSVFDVIAELKEQNRIPATATLGTRTIGDEVPENAVARITVRPHEMWWVIN